MLNPIVHIIKTNYMNFSVINVKFISALFASITICIMITANYLRLLIKII